MKDFGGFDEWHATCLIQAEVSPMNIPCFPTNHRSSGSHLARGACPELRLPHHQLRPQMHRRVCLLHLRRLHNSPSSPNPLVSAPSTQVQAERYAVYTFRMAVLLTWRPPSADN